MAGQHHLRSPRVWEAGLAMSTPGPSDILTDDEIAALDLAPDPSEVDAYAEAGIKVIRLHTRDKRPIITEWTKGEDRELVRRHVEDGGNLGTLIDEQRFVVDVDPRNGGNESLRSLERDLKLDLSPYPVVLTGGGGQHFEMTRPKDAKLRAKLAEYPGLDFKSSGQVVGAGSIHPNGRPYTWDSSRSALADAPEIPAALLKRLLKDVPLTSSAAAKALPCLSAEDGGVIAEGHRNVELTSFAGRLRCLGLEADAIFGELRQVNRARCSPPLLDAEVKAIATSVAGYAPGPDATTDLGNAARFAREHRCDLRHCGGLGKDVWFEWDERIWRQRRPDVAQERAKETVRRMTIEAACAPDENRRRELRAWARKCESRQRISSMLALASSEMELDAEELDSDWSLLSTPTGVVELGDGDVKLRSHRRDDFITRETAVGYNPKARCLVWQKVLRRSLPDSKMRDYLQRLVGYTLCGGQQEKAIFLVYGPPDGAKSTVVNAVAAALGGYAETTRLATFGEGADRNVNTPGLARLSGARMVLIPELPPFSALATGLLKAWSGGDSIEACQKYGLPFTFHPQGALWFVGNHRPTIRYDDEGAWRRMHVLPFEASIPEAEQDPEIGRQIDLAAVLAWAVGGYRRYREAGELGAPQTVREAVVDYRDEMDPLSRFAEDRLEFDCSSWEPVSSLHEAYLEWCASNQIYKPLSKRAFSDVLAARPGVKREQKGKKNVRAMSGVKLCNA